MRYIVVLMFLLVCTGCESHNMYEDRVKVQANTEDLSAVIWDYTIELAHDKQLRLENSYVVAGDGYSVIRMEFTSQAILEVGPARQLLVDLVEGFLDRVNKSPVAAELIPYPFDANHLEIYIDFESFYGVHVDPFYVGWMVLEQGMAYYYAFDLKNMKKDFWDARIEPYDKSRSYVYLERAAEEHYKAKHVLPPTPLSDQKYRPLSH